MACGIWTVEKNPPANNKRFILTYQKQIFTIPGSYDGAWDKPV
jgi:hypothetical protein